MIEIALKVVYLYRVIYLTYKSACISHECFPHIIASRLRTFSSVG